MRAGISIVDTFGGDSSQSQQWWLRAQRKRQIPPSIDGTSVVFGLVEKKVSGNTNMFLRKNIDVTRKRWK